MPVSEWDTGDRVVLVSNQALHGTVSFARSGFVTVRWDHGHTSMVWGADLAPEDTRAVANA